MNLLRLHAREAVGETAQITISKRWWGEVSEIFGVELKDEFREWSGDPSTFYVAGKK